MVIHNATFMVLQESEAGLVSWLRERISGLDCGAGRNPRLSAMLEAGGAPRGADDPASIAFQLEFDGIDDARQWSDGPFDALAADFAARFAPEAMVFKSIFEVL